MEITEKDGERLAAEFKAKHDARPVKDTCSLATYGSRTEHDGEVVNANTGSVIDDGIPSLLQAGYVCPETALEQPA